MSSKNLFPRDIDFDIWLLVAAFYHWDNGIEISHCFNTKGLACLLSHRGPKRHKTISSTIESQIFKEILPGHQLTAGGKKKKKWKWNFNYHIKQRYTFYKNRSENHKRIVSALNKQKNSNTGRMRKLDFQSYHNIILRMSKPQ